MSWRGGWQRTAAKARTVYPRGEAPGWVALWQRLDPRQESPEGDAMLGRLALICCVPLLIAYGSAGLLYGHLALLTPGGFIDMPGACAWLTATASLALAVAVIDVLVAGDRPGPSAPPPRSTTTTITTTHTIWLAPGRPLRQVALRTALPPVPPPPAPTRRLRAAGFIVAAIACASALVGRGLLALGLDAFARPVIALAPRAEWLLWPLPSVWSWLLPFARDDFVLGLVVIGIGLFFFTQFLAWRKVRHAWLPLALIVPLFVALAHLGSAAYDFAAARRLGGLRDADLVFALAGDPGRHNAYTFLSLWVAIGCASVGLLIAFLIARGGVLDDND
ncbi:hypothetical protein [Variovorax sp. LT1R16]|uniref:hypothetical protein n=1 Tax=Variovorax sp. LT1R16 TaxID=3443728 RepID=UPI003F477302